MQAATQLTAIEKCGTSLPDGHPVVAIVDDDPVARASTRYLLESEGYRVRSFASGDAFLDARDLENLTCVLLDIQMPGQSGLDVLHVLAGRRPSPPILIVTGHAHIDMAVTAMKLGAVDFIQKPYTPAQLLRALAAVTPREQSNAAKAVDRDMGRLVEGLSKRQRQVLAGIVRGHLNKVIAWDLQLSVRTVECYRSTLFKRLGVRSVAEAVRIALAAGIDGDAGEDQKARK